MQALRVWTRVLNNISRLSAQEQPTSDASSAFTSSTTDKNAPLADFPNGSRKRQPAPSSGPNAGLVWQVSEVRSFCLTSLQLSDNLYIRSPSHPPSSASPLCTPFAGIPSRRSTTLSRQSTSPRTLARRGSSLAHSSFGLRFVCTLATSSTLPRIWIWSIKFLER